MGEAKRRQAEIDRLKNAHADWRATLSPIESQAAQIAERAHARLVEGLGLTGGCYLLAFFLRQYMRANGIDAEAIVGWVNDGTSPIMASHAWVEVSGKKIDVSLIRTDDPELQPSGALLILDHIVRPGAATYTYHREQSQESFVELMKLRESAPQAMLDVIDAKMAEHQRMLATARSEPLIAAYLNAAPRDRTYEALVRALT